MSEQRKYEFGDPVSVFMNGEWREGCYLQRNGDPNVPHRVTVKGLDYPQDRQDDEVSPRSVAPSRGWRLPEPGDVVRAEGIDHDVTLRSVAILAMFAECEDDCGIHGADPRLIRVVRLHDAPAEAPAPDLSAATVNGLYDYTGHDWIKVKAFRSIEGEGYEDALGRHMQHHREETGFLIAEVRKLASELNRRIKAERMAEPTEPDPHPALDDVTAARHLLDMVRGERPGTDAIVLDAAAKILDRAATALAERGK